MVGPTARKVGPTAQKVGPTAEKVGPAAEKVGPAAEKVGPAATVCPTVRTTRFQPAKLGGDPHSNYESLFARLVDFECSKNESSEIHQMSSLVQMSISVKMLIL